MADMKPKKDPLEEAHFRLDEHQRDIDGLKSAADPAAIARVAHGALAGKLDEVKADAAADRKVAEGLAALVEELKKTNELLQIIAKRAAEG
jgi:hypothetical protein